MLRELGELLNQWTETLSGWISLPLIFILLGSGLFVTFSLRWVQLRKLKHSFDVVGGKYDNPDDEGDVTHFQALSAALSSTIGIGNIAGVALAVRLGGPGAIFWMWVTALFGMALKFAECSLSHRFRVIHEDGSASGGPMYYIERGLGPNWKPLAIFFATCAVICSFCTGNMNQANTIAQTYANHEEIKLAETKPEDIVGRKIFKPVLNPVTQETLFEKGHTLSENEVNQLSSLGIENISVSKFGLPEWGSGLFIAFMVGLVIIGGIKRIAAVASRLVPTMAVLYIGGALMILFLNAESILPSVATIFREAFSLEAGWGGLITVVMWGIRRGLYSNEAGQGSAPIAHAAAKTKESVREGAVAQMGPFIDTIIICSMTGLAIISTGVLESTNLTGAQLTRAAFQRGFAFAPEIGSTIVNFSVLLFAYTTMVAWSYYGDRSIEYLVGPQAIRPYRWVYVFFNFMGAILPLTFVWNFGDIALSLMTIPNLIGVIFLTGTLKVMSADYFSRKHLTYKEYLVLQNEQK